MRHLGLALLLSGLLAAAVAGCGGGGGAGGGGGGTSSPQAATVTVTFPPSPAIQPVATAVAIESGPFAPVSLQSGQISVSLPAGTTRYSIAYLCQSAESVAFFNEFVIQATTQDATSLGANCFQGVTVGGLVTDLFGSVGGSADATSIPGTAGITINGNLGFGTTIGSSQGSFGTSMLLGTNDVAVVAVDSSLNRALAVKIIRGQTVPGTVNGGNTIVFGSADQTANQSFSIANVPVGFATPPMGAVDFGTANGTLLQLESASASQYPAMPAAAVQNGDFYIYTGVAQIIPPAPNSVSRSTVGMIQLTKNGGGPTTIALPNPWSSSNPTTTTMPLVFTFNYAGFSGMPVLGQQVSLRWIFPLGVTTNTITVFATANFQNGANTITIPNAISVPEFPGCCPSGASISWTADILGATPLKFSPPGLSFSVPFTFTPPILTAPPNNLPANASVAVVENTGTFTAP